MANNQRICFHISESLLIALKETTKISKMNHNTLLIELTKKIKRPDRFQKNYKPFFNGELTEKIDFKISEEARVGFMTLAAVFKSHYHALDYLLYEEKNSRFNVINFS